MIDVSILRAMAAAGASQEAIFAAIEADQKIISEVKAVKREADRIRKRNQRARPKDTADIVGQRGTDGTTPSSPSPPSSSPLTLSLITTPSSSPSPSASLRSAAPKRATRIPEDWKPTTVDFEFAHGRGVPHGRIAAEAEKFKTYWHGASKNATSPDWAAKWRTWILNLLEREGKPNAAGKRTVQQASSDLLERIRAFDEPAPSSLRDGTGQADVRLLPSR